MNRIGHISQCSHAAAIKGDENQRSMFPRLLGDELLYDLRHRFLIARRLSLKPGFDLRFGHEV